MLILSTSGWDDYFLLDSIGLREWISSRAIYLKENNPLNLRIMKKVLWKE